MRRREFIAGLAGAAAAFPRTAGAQQPTTPVIGLLSAETPALYARQLSAFHQGLNETGYTEGKNVAIEYRWAEGRNDRLPSLAEDLVRHRVAVIATAGAGSFAAKRATTELPIVAFVAVDPVERACFEPR